MLKFYLEWLRLWKLRFERVFVVYRNKPILYQPSLNDWMKSSVLYRPAIIVKHSGEEWQEYGTNFFVQNNRWWGTLFSRRESEISSNETRLRSFSMVPTLNLFFQL